MWNRLHLDVVGVFAFKFCKDKTNLADCLSLYKINLGLEGDGNILFSRVLSQKRIIVSQPLRKDINGCHKKHNTNYTCND